MHMPKLASLIAPIPLEEFFDTYFEKKPLVIQRDDPSFYSDLWTLEQFDHVLTNTDLRHPSFRMIKDAQQLPLGDITRNMRWGAGYFYGIADVDRILEQHRNGATIVLQAMHRNAESLYKFCSQLESELSRSVQTNIYMTPATSQGFAPHFDTHDVMVLQISGAKIWRIYDSPAILPDSSQHYDREQHGLGKPTHEFEIHPGDFIYIPRGFVHEALTADLHSMHITVGMPSTTWAQIFDEIVRQCRDHVNFRKSLPIGFEKLEQPSTEMLRIFQHLLQEFTEVASLEKALNALGERYVATSVPNYKNGILQTHLLDTISLDTKLQRRTEALHRITADEHKITLSFFGKKVSFPAKVQKQIRYLCSVEEPFGVSEIPGNISDESKIVLAKRLAREGYLGFADISARPNESTDKV